MNDDNLSQLFDLLDTLPNPVTLNERAYDENGELFDKIIYVNKSFLKTIGYTTEDIPDDRVWFLKAYPQESYQHYIATEWFKAIAKAKEENSDLKGFPAKVRCKDGEDRWFSITTQIDHPISDKYRTIILVQTESPSETKLELDEKSLNLINKKLLLRTIIDTVPIRIFWKDRDGVYLGCNRAFLEDAGLKNEDEIIGKTDYDMIWKEDAERFIADDKRVIESGISELNFVERQPQAEGKYITLSTSKVPLKGSSGETIGILGIYQDITEEHEMKETLKEKEKMLHFQSRQAAMGDMIAMIAHQWRQPLSTISAIACNIQIQQALGSGSEEKLKEHSAVLLDQTQYLAQTISDFRNFYKQDKAVKTVQAADIIKDSLLIIDQLLNNSNISLHTSYCSVKQFNTYPKELQHVLINLIKNAADILLEKEGERWVKIATLEDEESVVFEVSDNGGGIDQTIIEHVFEPYFSTKKEKNGTGLGLYMSQTIVERNLKGTISCKNTAEGAVFTVRLPIIETAL